MERSTPDSDERVFLVRIRVDRTGAGSIWRGYVADITRGGFRCYVARPSDVAEFISARLSMGRPVKDDA